MSKYNQGLSLDYYTQYLYMKHILHRILYTIFTFPQNENHNFPILAEKLGTNIQNIEFKYKFLFSINMKNLFFYEHFFCYFISILIIISISF